MAEVPDRTNEDGLISTMSDPVESPNNTIGPYGPPKPTWIKLTVPGTNYCGPGGSGKPTNGVDQLCMQHDACYEANGISFATNLGNMIGVPMPSHQVAIQTCNQNLCQGLSSLATYSSSENAQAFAVGAAFGCIP